MNPALLGAADQHLGEVVAPVVKLEEEGDGGFLGDLFHAAIGAGAEHHQGVGHACAAGGGHLSLGVGAVVGTGGADEDGHTEFIAQHGG